MAAVADHPLRQESGDGYCGGVGVDVRDCRRLILESPYYSLESLGYHYLPIYPWGRMLHYHFPTYSYLPKVTAPVTIFHGTEDRTVPYSNALRLKAVVEGWG